jgi:PHD-finger
MHPPLADIPDGQWLCNQCAVCVSCTKPHIKGQRRKGPLRTHWQHAIVHAETSKTMGTYIATYCETCFEGYDNDRYCPVCMKVYDSESTDPPMVCCDMCDRWVHLSCDPDAALQGIVDTDAKFVCGLCDDKKLSALIVQRLEKDPDFTFKIAKKDGLRLCAPPAV